MGFMSRFPEAVSALFITLNQGKGIDEICFLKVSNLPTLVMCAIVASFLVGGRSQPTIGFASACFFRHKSANCVITSKLLFGARHTRGWRRSICGRSISEIGEFAGLLLCFCASYVNENTTVQSNVSGSFFKRSNFGRYACLF